MDIITLAAKRLGNEAKRELQSTTRMGIMLALTIVSVLATILPSWIIFPLIAAGWGLLAKDHYDAAVAWATDAPADEEEDTPLEDQKPVDGDEQK